MIFPTALLAILSSIMPDVAAYEMSVMSRQFYYLGLAKLESTTNMRQVQFNFGSYSRDSFNVYPGSANAFTIYENNIGRLVSQDISPSISIRYNDNQHDTYRTNCYDSVDGTDGILEFEEPSFGEDYRLAYRCWNVREYRPTYHSNHIDPRTIVMKYQDNLRWYHRPSSERRSLLDIGKFGTLGLNQTCKPSSGNPNPCKSPYYCALLANSLPDAQYKCLEAVTKPNSACSSTKLCVYPLTCKVSTSGSRVCQR